jgi:hypothetical protein
MIRTKYRIQKIVEYSVTWKVMNDAMSRILAHLLPRCKNLVVVVVVVQGIQRTIYSATDS